MKRVLRKVARVLCHSVLLEKSCSHVTYSHATLSCANSVAVVVIGKPSSRRLCALISIQLPNRQIS